MIVIDQFYEWFYFATLSNSLLAHSCCDLAWVTFDSSDESVTEGMRFGTIVKGFEDDGFSACVSSSSDERYFTWFQD